MSCLRVIILSAVVTLCAAQRCCTPPQWEGMQAEAGGVVINQRGVKTNDYLDISFDYTNKKMSVISNNTVGATQTATWVIQHFTEGVMYTIDLMTKKCTKGKLETPMERACIPETAKPGVKVVYGGGSQRLQCQTYTWKQTGPETDIDYFLAVVEEGGVCYPVAEEVGGAARGTPLVETYGFVNLSNGIKDPSIFNPPSFCNQVPMSTVTAKKGYTFLGLYR